MDKATEIAEKIAKRIVNWFPDGEEIDEDQAAEIIAAALRQYRDEALEEAACLANGMGDDGIENAIRALKTPSEGKGKEAMSDPHGGSLVNELQKAIAERDTWIDGFNNVEKDRDHWKALAERAREALENAQDQICDEFCGGSHHPFCVQAKDALTAFEGK